MATGPVSAAVAAATTLGWSHAGGAAWKMRCGNVVDFRLVAPRTVKLLAERDAKELAWIQAAARHDYLSHLEGLPYLGAAHHLTGASSPLSAKQQGLLRAFLAGA